MYADLVPMDRWISCLKFICFTERSSVAEFGSISYPSAITLSSHSSLDNGSGFWYQPLGTKRNQSNASATRLAQWSSKRLRNRATKHFPLLYSTPGRKQGEQSSGVDFVASSSPPAAAPLPEVMRRREIDVRCIYPLLLAYA